jgi:hypothetical protein
MPPHQVHEAWIERGRRTPWTEVWRMAWWPHTALPRVAAVVGGIALYVLAGFGAIRV